MTPAERLLAAADLLDKRVREATEGPWAVYGDGDGVTAIIGGSDREYGVVEDRDLVPDDAHYIATVDPEVGKALAGLLRWEADCVAFNDGRHALAIADLILASAQ